MTQQTDTVRDEIKRIAESDPELAYRSAGYSGELQENGNKLVGLCPFHNDTDPSFKITTTGKNAGRWWCHGACNEGGDIFEFRQKLTGEPFPDAKQALADALGIPTPEPKPEKPWDIGDYAEYVEIPERFLRQIGVGPYARGGVIMFHKNPQGENLRGYLRKTRTERKWAGKRGQGSFLYGLDRLTDETPLIVVEGHSDAQTLWHNGYNALGVPGQNYKTEWIEYLTDFSTVYVAREPNSDGSPNHLPENILEAFAKDRTDPPEIRELEMPGEHGDIQDLWKSLEGDPGDDDRKTSFSEHLQQAIETAEPLSLIEARQRIARLRLGDLTDVLADQAKTDTDPGKLIHKVRGKLKDIEKQVLQGMQAPDLVGYDEIGEMVDKAEWLWEDWLPLGHMSMLMGPVGAGKTWAALALAACITDRRPWPDASSGSVEPQTVIWLDYESGQATLYNRMQEAQITPSQFKGISPDDMTAELYLDHEDAPDILRKWIGDHNAPLVVIDSLRHAFLGVDENDSRIATFMTPFAQVAQETQAAILLIHHTNKRQGANLEDDAWMLNIESARGSSAIAALTRSVLGVEKPDAGLDTRRLRVIKHNLCPQPDPVGFDVIQHDDETSSLQWCDAPFKPVELGKREKAAEFLRIELQDGPQKSSDLLEKAKDEGISQSTLYRAAKRVQIVKKNGTWGLRSYRNV